MKLPVGATIVLADGSENTIQSGDVTINVSGGYKKNQYFTALDAAGSLTIQAGTKGAGTLSGFAGSHPSAPPVPRLIRGGGGIASSSSPA